MDALQTLGAPPALRREATPAGGALRGKRTTNREPWERAGP